jgi:EAL domain-containing protein (putative c-di-GMP-specific phosphodiesterase class I)
VSGLQLVQGRFAERLIGFLRQFEIGPEQIQLEVTESTNMLNLEEVMRQMAMLADIGIRFAIDDFGTGHSTLNRLDKLPLGVLQIDRTFTERLCEVDGTRSIVQAMISMAKALKMRVVAEGVERQEQIVMLHDMGCDSLQGFLLSRPVPALHIPSLVERRHPALTKVGKLSHKA